MPELAEFKKDQLQQMVKYPPMVVRNIHRILLFKVWDNPTDWSR